MNGKKSKGGVCQKTATRRLTLVRAGKASWWMPSRTLEQAIAKAGL